jgi:uncharacterized OB-fold protein
MNELIGKCPKCRTSYFGYALTNPPRQNCSKCGSSLEISKNGIPVMVFSGYFAPVENKIGR